MTGKFTASFHFFKKNRELNHVDIFLRPPNYDCLITYKLPKNILGGRRKNPGKITPEENSEWRFAGAVLQKNHRLAYLTYEGNIHDDLEKIRIIKQGIFWTHPWILTDDILKSTNITFLNGAKKRYQELSIKSMWKKTDFKLPIDEIKLYEITEDRILTKSDDATGDVQAVEMSKSDDQKSVNPENLLETQIIEVITPEPTPPSVTTTVSKSIDAKTTEPAMEPAKGNNQPHRFEFQEVQETDFVPINELILEESGKTAGEYKLRP